MARVAGIPSPVSIACAADGMVHAISQGRVVRFSRTATTPVTVIPAGQLQAPWRLSVDPASGDIWVAENSDRAGGPRHHQVKRFSATGALIGAFGRADGRQDGIYRPGDFRGITDITADGDGGAVVVEQWGPPRRVVRIDGAGAVRREWYNGQVYGLVAFPEPDDPTIVWFQGRAPVGQEGLIRAKVDVVNRSWHILESYVDVLTNNGLVGSQEIFHPRIYKRGSQRYIVNGGGSPSGLWILRYDPATRTLSPAAMSGIAFNNQGSWTLPAAYRPTDGSQPGSFLWSDLDDDGIATRDELRYADFRIGGWIHPQTLAIYSTPVATDFDPNQGIRVPTGFTPAGNPIYPTALSAPLPDWGEGASWDGTSSGGNTATTLNRSAAGWLPGQWTGFTVRITGGRGAGQERRIIGNSSGQLQVATAWNATDIPDGTSVFSILRVTYDSHGRPWRYHPVDFRVDVAGNTYGAISRALEDYEWHGWWFFNNSSGIDRVVKWDAQGRQLWSAGRHSPDPDHDIGSQSLPRTLAAVVKDCVVWNDASDEEYIGASVWTSDGLWVGEIPNKAGNAADEQVYVRNNNEYPQYYIAEDPLSGQVLFYGQTPSGGAPIYRINGWEGIERTTGTVVKGTDTPVIVHAGTGLRAEYFANTTFSGAPAVVRTDPELWVNWAAGSPAPGQIPVDQFSVRWTGRVTARTTGETRFALQGGNPYENGGDPSSARVWLDGRQILDWGDRLWDTNDSYTDRGGRVLLEAGRSYDLRVEAVFTTGNAALSLCWDTPELDRQHIDRIYLRPATAGTVAAPRPAQGEWRLDEAAGGSGADATGLAPALVLAGSPAPGWAADGISGAALRFAGGTGHAAATMAAPAGGRSLALWFRTAAPAGGLAGFRHAGGGDGDLWVEGGRLHARIGSGAGETLRGDDPVADGRWHQAIHVVGGDELGQRLYLDGRLVAAGAAEASDLGPALGLLIGRSAGGGTSFTGDIDQVRIHHRALSAREIADEWLRGDQGLIAHLPFDDGAGVTARSVAGSPMVFATLTDGVDWIPGRFGRAVRVRDGAQVYLDNEIRLPDRGFTLSYWMRTTATFFSSALIRRDQAFVNNATALGMSIDAGEFFVSSIGNPRLYTPGKINNGAWRHIAVTVDEGPAGLELYLDGVRVGAVAASRLGGNATRWSLDLGAFNQGNSPLTGPVDFDDLRIYGRVLGAAEILALRNGTPVNPVAPPPTPAAPVVTGNGTAAPTLSGSAVAGQRVRILVDGAEVGFVAVPSTGTWSYDLFGFSPGSYQASVTVGNSGGTSPAGPAAPVTVGTAADTTPPPTPAAPIASSHTIAAPVLSGTTEPAATVRIIIDGVQVGTAQAGGADGAWTWTVAPPLAPGQHAVRVQAVDGSGNASGVSAATILTVAAANAAPVLSTAATAAADRLALP